MTVLLMGSGLASVAVPPTGLVMVPIQSRSADDVSCGQGGWRGPPSLLLVPRASARALMPRLLFLRPRCPE